MRHAKLARPHRLDHPDDLLQEYTFQNGYPTQETIQRVYDEADLNRAIVAYKFFYPTVSGAAIFKGNAEVGVLPNQTFGILDAQPRHLIYTANSDTPYSPILLDLNLGPMIVELPPGPLIFAVQDLNQRWVADMGIPGPDAGNGGKHLILSPCYEGVVPKDYYIWHSTSYRVIAGARSLPVNGDVKGAIERLKTIQVKPLNPPADWKEPQFIDLTETPQDTTPLRFETDFIYWELLHEVINQEPPFEEFRDYYGELAILGIVRGKPFNPDARMKTILEKAAQLGNVYLRVQAFADRRKDRFPWVDRKWEWVALRFENGDFNTTSYLDVDAREKWFFQAIGASPAMFQRKAGQGSLYWGGYKDQTGAYLDGAKNYKLSVPQPVPGKLFWSVTVYDIETRSQIQTHQGKAALRSLFELEDQIATGQETVELFFGPKAPPGKEGHWIQTIPGKGWFAYFRIYVPEAEAFDGTWKPGDFERI